MSAEVWAVHSRESAKPGTDQRQEAVQYHGTWGTHRSGSLKHGVGSRKWTQVRLAGGQGPTHEEV